MAIIKLSATERRRLSAFFTCLVLAGFAWVFTTLSSPYSYTIKAVLVYKNSPQRRAFHALQPDTVSVTTQGSGWQMLMSRLKNEKKVISVDLHSLDNKDFIVLSSQLDIINGRKDLDQRIASITPDTLYFDFSNRSIRRVPVRLLTAIKYQRQYAQSGDIGIYPNYVVLTGPSNLIDKIKTWDTDSLSLDSVNETINTRVNLKPVMEGSVAIYPKSVHVTVPVDEFTEKTLEIPVKLINNHDFYGAKIFPQKVSVTFTTALSRYAETEEDLFELSADLNLWRERGYSVLPVKLARLPLYSKIVKIEPRNVDFIIRK